MLCGPSMCLLPFGLSVQGAQCASVSLQECGAVSVLAGSVQSSVPTTPDGSPLLSGKRTGQRIGCHPVVGAAHVLCSLRAPNSACMLSAHVYSTC